MVPDPDAITTTATPYDAVFNWSALRLPSSVKGLFGFQWGLMVASRSQLGLPA
jgi:hypothetical protein